MQYFLFKDYHVENKKTDGTKKCKECDKYLSPENFPLRSDGGFRRTICKKCTDKHRKIVKELRIKNPMEDPENYVCPICLKGNDECKGLGGKSVGSGSAWVLDHCHKTLTFRGYLCHSCNKGVFRDDIELHERKLEYLKRHEEKVKKEG